MRYEGPALFINGAKSHAVTDQDKDIIKERFPDARMRTIPGTGHWVHAEKQKEFLSAVLDFLHEGISTT